MDRAIAILSASLLWLLPCAAAAEPAPAQLIRIPARYGRVLQIVAGADGDMWADTDLKGPYLLRISPSGRVLHAYRPRNLRPGPLAVGPDGNIWFFALTPDRRSFDVATLGYLTARGRVREFPQRRLGDSLITGLVAGPDGNMWFTDGHVVGRLTPAGQLRLLIAPRRTSIASIAEGPDGNLWLTGDPAGLFELSPVGRWRTLTRTRGGGELAVDQNGDAWTARDHAGGVQRFSSGGLLTEVRTPVPVEGIGLGPDGNIWFAGEGRIGSISPSGTLTSNALLGLRFGPSGADLVPGPDGRTWISTITYGKLWAITPDPPVQDAPARIQILRARVTGASPNPFGPQPQSHPARRGLGRLDGTPACGAAAGPAATTACLGPVPPPDFAHLQITLRCTGQPGRYCHGTITAADAYGMLIHHVYAVATGATLSLRLTLNSSVFSPATIPIAASTRDPTTGVTQTARTTATAH